MTAWGIVVAAGEGRRFGTAKHQLELRGRALWEWARRTLLDGGCEDVIVVGSVPGGTPGGPRRRDSVAAGLAEVPDVDHVLIHDAARPLATSDLAARVLTRLRQGDVEGVVPAVPVRDTVKRIQEDRVVETPDRSSLVAVQTPQAFRRVALVEAHARSDVDVSDDALLIERAGGAVAVVEGEVGNVKITYPEDLRVAEALLG